MSIGSNLGLLIAAEVLFGIGFFALLFSAYGLVLDRWVFLQLILRTCCVDRSPFRIELLDNTLSTSRISRLIQNRHLFRLALTVAVALGIAASNLVTSSNASSRSTGNSLREASTIIFLVLTVLQTYQTVLFVIHNHTRTCPMLFLFLLAQMLVFLDDQSKYDHEKWGSRHASHILCLISVLLLIREIFLTATISNSTKQNNEHFWYPLVAVPEILAVMLYAIPGLVPGRSELPK